MPVPSPTVSILLCTADQTVQAQVRQIFPDASVTIIWDAATLHKELPKQPVDVVIMESRDGREQSSVLPDHLDSSHTLFIQGSRAVLRKTLKMIQLMNPPSHPHINKSREGSLENYLETKMGDFVKGMRNGSARNLHPILISAVERPLITSALRETRGNQIQAAELLGLNRNTLRKKIVNLHIPLKQTKLRANRSA
jgi:two-component system nitrogen regulation response regulator GlnG